MSRNEIDNTQVVASLPEIQPEQYDQKYDNEIDHQELKGDVLDAQLKSSLDKLTIMQTFKVFRVTILVCALAGFSAATDGYQNKVAANIVANKGFIAQFKPAGESVLDATHVATFGGMFSAGQVLGQFGIQWMAEWTGRKGAAWTFMALLLVSITVEVVSKQWWHFTLAKTIAGLGVGASQAILPVYINEHSPVQIRGILLLAYSLWFSVGGLFGSITLKVGADNDPMNWKMPIYTQYGMVGLSILIFLLLPESPWWLVSKGKTDRARKILERKFKSVPNYDIDNELSIIVNTIEMQKAYNVSAGISGRLAIFKGLHLKRFLIASWPKVLQQFVGLSVFSSYSAYFFKLAGNKDPFSVTVILACTSLAAVVVDVLLVDKIGRRRMTLIGFSGACTGVTLMSIVGCLDFRSPQLGAVLVFAGVFASFCNTFQSSTSYAYLTELPDQKFKSLSTGWGLAYCNLYAVMFNFTVPLMLKKWEVKAAFLFVALGVPGTILAYFIMPESMNRSPAEIQEMFEERISMRKWKGHVTAVERDLDAREGLARV